MRKQLQDLSEWLPDHALDMVIEAKPSFDSRSDRPGWGWHWQRRGKPSLFIRQTKHGYSATADRDAEG